jgi:hypothetical protein
MAELIVWTVSTYIWIGAVVAVLFLLFGIDRADPSAHGAYAFRPLLLPGLTRLWPYVLRRWARVGVF